MSVSVSVLEVTHKQSGYVLPSTLSVTVAFVVVVDGIVAVVKVVVVAGPTATVTCQMKE